MKINPEETVAAFAVLTRARSRNSQGGQKSESFSALNAPIRREKSPIAPSSRGNESVGSEEAPRIASDKRGERGATKPLDGHLSYDGISIHPKHREHSDYGEQPPKNFEKLTL